MELSKSEPTHRFNVDKELTAGGIAVERIANETELRVFRAVAL